MPVDNELYDRLAHTWHDETQVLSYLRTGMNPARFGYFRHVLTEDLRLDPQRTAALDIGCGGGLLAEEFARLGFRVTGIDPSAPTLQAARRHAAQVGLEIDYHRGVGEAVPFRDASFDVVYCCDVLEHVDDLERVVAEAARVLKPGGVYCYDTINRTFLSKLVVIKLLQEWPATSIMPPHVHDWSMFIKPSELLALLRRHGLTPQAMAGLGPAANPITFIGLLLRHKQGKLTFPDVARQAVMRHTRDTSISYMGYARKPHHTPLGSEAQA